LTEAVCNSAPEAVVAEVLDWFAFRDAGVDLLEQVPRRIGAAIVDDHDFVRNLLQAQFEVKVLDGGSDAALFVPAGITTESNWSGSRGSGGGDFMRGSLPASPDD
jgi:hypothetical protein